MRVVGRSGGGSGGRSPLIKERVTTITSAYDIKETKGTSSPESFSSCAQEFSGDGERGSLLPPSAGSQRRAPPPLDLSQISSKEIRGPHESTQPGIIKEGLYEFVAQSGSGSSGAGSRSSGVVSQGEDNPVFDMSVESGRGGSSLKGSGSRGHLEKMKSLKVNFIESQEERATTPTSAPPPHLLPGDPISCPPQSFSAGCIEATNRGFDGEAQTGIHTGRNHTDRGASSASPLSPKPKTGLEEAGEGEGDGGVEVGAESGVENHIVDGSLSPPCETSM